MYNSTCSSTLATLGTLGICRPKSVRLTTAVAVPTICVSETAVASTVNVAGMVMSRMVKSPTRLKLIASPTVALAGSPSMPVGVKVMNSKLPVSRISF